MQFKVSIWLLTAVLFAVSMVTVVTCGVPTTLINSIGDQINLDASVHTLFPQVDNLTQKLERVSQCYEPELAKQNVDLFNRDTSIKSVVDQYYQAFPHKTITTQTINQLIVSIKQITSSCLQTELDTVQYGFTELSDMSISQLQSMTGAAVGPLDYNEPSIGKVGLKSGFDPACSKNATSIPDRFDWRDHGVVTPIRNQGTCGSCWSFASVASIESALLIRGVDYNVSSNLDLSEQQLVDCAKTDGCVGGSSVAAFDYVQKHGLTTNQAYPYKGTDNGCGDKVYPKATNISDYCVRSFYPYNSNFETETLSDRDMQQSLVNNGPLFVLLYADQWAINYRGGVVTRPCTVTFPPTNHAVLLVGYTPEAWILKNSWGTQWGKDGYFQFARGQNLCAINTEIAWPLL